MASTPLFTFKAGQCSQSGARITPLPEEGYVYLYREDDLTHFCWRRRSQPATSPELDLIMFPQDGSFTPLAKDPNSKDVKSPTSGRIYVLRFQSSGDKHFFWLQSKTQHPQGDLSAFSERDRRLGDVVDALLAGDEDINVQEIMSGANSYEDDDGNGDADEMDLDGAAGSRRQSQTGGAGADATGGDPREEGEASRDGGADGGRAVDNETNTIVQNFLDSLKGKSIVGQQQQQSDRPFTSLPDLLPPAVTVSYLDNASTQEIDHLCAYLPPDLFLLVQQSGEDSSSADPEPTPAAAHAAIEALSLEQKKSIIKRVLRSPQLQQSLGSLTVALRDGGLPMIGEALGLKLEHGGMIQEGTMPLGGGSAVEAFVEGVKRTVYGEGKQEDESNR